MLSLENSRSTVFTHLLFEFRINVDGPVTDVTVHQDGTIYIIAVSPAKLFIVSPNLENVKVVELYEYIPSNLGIKLKIRLLSSNQLCIHNSQEHFILTIDFDEGIIKTTTISGLDPVSDSLFAYGDDFGDLSIIYQTGQKTLIAIDHLQSQQHLYRWEIPIDCVVFIGKSKLLLQSEGNFFICSLMQKNMEIIAVDNLKKNHSNSFFNILADINLEKFMLASEEFHFGYSTSQTLIGLDVFGYRRDQMSRTEDSIYLKNTNQFVNVLTATEVFFINFRGRPIVAWNLSTLEGKRYTV